MVDSSGTPDPRGFDRDFDGSTPTDPRGHRVHQAPHDRSLQDQDRGTYDDSNVPDNGSRRRHNDADSKGSLSNDLTDGRGGQR